VYVAATPPRIIDIRLGIFALSKPICIPMLVQADGIRRSKTSPKIMKTARKTKILANIAVIYFIFQSLPKIMSDICFSA